MHIARKGFNIKKYYEKLAEENKEKSQEKRATLTRGEGNLFDSEIKIEGAEELKFEDLHPAKEPSKIKQALEGVKLHAQNRGAEERTASTVAEEAEDDALFEEGFGAVNYGDAILKKRQSETSDKGGLKVSLLAPSSTGGGRKRRRTKKRKRNKTKKTKKRRTKKARRSHRTKRR